jgi:hypothetical protein
VGPQCGEIRDRSEERRRRRGRVAVVVAATSTSTSATSSHHPFPRRQQQALEHLGEVVHRELVVQLRRGGQHPLLERGPELDGGRDEGGGGGGGDGRDDKALVEATLRERKRGFEVGFGFSIAFSSAPRSLFVALDEDEKEESERDQNTQKEKPEKRTHPDERPEDRSERARRGLRHAEDCEVALEAVGDVVLAVTRGLHGGDVAVRRGTQRKRGGKGVSWRLRKERKKDEEKNLNTVKKPNFPKKKNSSSSFPPFTPLLPRIDDAAHVPDRLLQRVHAPDF